MKGLLLNKVENIVAKEEIAHYPLPQYIQKSSAAKESEIIYMWAKGYNIDIMMSYITVLSFINNTRFSSIKNRILLTTLLSSYKKVSSFYPYINTTFRAFPF